MDFTPDETQEAVAEVATALLARELEPDALWAAFAEADLLTLALPERLGGEGLSVTDVGSLLVEVGRAAAPIPALATLGFGVLPIVALGTDAQQDELLTGVSAGRVFTAALGEPGQQFPAQPSTTAHQSGDWYRVSGTVLAVPFAASAHENSCAHRRRSRARRSDRRRRGIDADTQCVRQSGVRSHHGRGSR